MNHATKSSQPARLSVSLAPQPSTFAPLLFSGRLAEGIEALSKLGFTAAEISLRTVDDINVKWLDKRLTELGLSVSAFATGRMYLEDSLCLCDTNPIVRQQLSERFSSIIQLAAHFKASVIIGGVRGRLAGDKQHSSEQISSATDTLSNLAGQASDTGVNLLLEPINRYETNFINTALEGLELIENIGNPHIKLLLDTFHMNIEEINLCKTIRTAGKQLGYVHFADSNRRAPGWGHIDFSAILEALKDIGFQGFITAEILPIPNDARALQQTRKFFHSLLEGK